VDPLPVQRVVLQAAGGPPPVRAARENAAKSAVLVVAAVRLAGTVLSFNQGAAQMICPPINPFGNWKCAILSIGKIDRTWPL
jgi:hypothetical protein